MPTAEKGEKMTNREWLESLTDEEFADMIAYENCQRTCAYVNGNMCGHKSCESGIAKWLKQEYEPPKKELSQAQLCEAFELKFGNRRAISLDEVREVTKEVFK